MATPPESVTGPPTSLPSTWNCTVPVRVPAPGNTALTVAVKTTGWPNTEGLIDEANVVVVLAWLTVCVKVEEVLGRKLLFPLYTAVNECTAARSVLLVHVTDPALHVFVASEFA